jgi:GTP:adenosylcobinamide-phosphate guanylyltransferase
MIENLDQLKMKKKRKKRTENNKRQKKKTLLTKKIEVFQSNDGGYEEDMQIKMPRYS